MTSRYCREDTGAVSCIPISNWHATSNLFDNLLIFHENADQRGLAGIIFVKGFSYSKNRTKETSMLK